MIIANSLEHHTPQFRVLSDGQCQELYAAALECLERVGIQVHNQPARDLLVAHGARADGHIVRIPVGLVKKAVAVTPREFTVWGRDGKHEMRVALDRVHFGPGPTCTYFIDPTTGERRKARRGDAGMVAKVCDALPNIDYIMGLSLFDDVTAVLAPVYEFAEELANTSKPIVAWANTPETFRDIYELAAAVVGSESALRDKPIFAYFTTYESPLKLADGPIGKSDASRRARYPIRLPGRADRWAGVAVHERIGSSAAPGQRAGCSDHCPDPQTWSADGDWRPALHDGPAYGASVLWFAGSQPALCRCGGFGSLSQFTFYGYSRRL